MEEGRCLWSQHRYGVSYPVLCISPLAEARLPCQFHEAAVMHIQKGSLERWIQDLQPGGSRVENASRG